MFFAAGFEKATMIPVEKYYHKLYKGQIITITRNPLDSISSFLSMEAITHSWNEEQTLNMLNSHVAMYEDMYEHLNEYATIVLTYEGVVNDLNKAISAICEPRGIIYSPIDVSQISYEPLSYRVDSSRVLGNYENIKSLVEGYDLRKSNKLYKALSAKAIV